MPPILNSQFSPGAQGQVLAHKTRAPGMLGTQVLMSASFIVGLEGSQPIPLRQ